ncbi:MAG TPA: hypothetical protein VF942_11340 [Acidimicrobiales bacterium]
MSGGADSDAVRHAGLDVTVWSSDGKRTRGHLAKQGPPVLHGALYEAAMYAARPTFARPLVLPAWRAVWGAQRANPVYRARYQYLTSREHNRLTPTQAQTVIAAAILRHLHAVITTGHAWDPLTAAHGTWRPSSARAA